MTLSLSNPFALNVKQPQPMFKSVRTQRPRIALNTAVIQPEEAIEPDVETLEPDTWYDKKSPFEVLLDMFWARRNLLGDMRTRRAYRNALRWQAAATLPLFPPLGALVVLMNICFGLRARTTRVAFITSLVLASLVLINTMTHSDPILLAALR